MKGDFSRKTFKKEKNYSGVLKQQGRVSLDADWNESVDIIAHQRQTRTVDTIGVCGAPIHSSGFEIRHSGDGNLDNLLITTGRFYAGGLLCELHPTGSVSIEFVPRTNTKAKLKELKIGQVEIQANQWIMISTREHANGMVTKVTHVSKRYNEITIDPGVPKDYLFETAPILRLLIPYRGQPDYPEVPEWRPKPGKIYLVYLDVWQRHITAIEDPELREVALRGPDTDTRIKEIAQVKIFPTPVEFKECKGVIPFDRLFPPSGARLKTQVVAGTTPEDPCLIAEGGGYRGLENRLYRVEIHQGGDVGTAKFKWSRDNGSIVYAIQEFIPDKTDRKKVFKVKLKQIGRDKILKIKENDWLEILGDETDLDVENAGTMSQVTHVDEAQRILTLSVNVAQHKNESHPKVRRWDTGIDTVTLPVLTSTRPINLEDGVQISFDGGNFKVGDYWVFAARTATGEVEELDDEPPQGIKHYYCSLALVRWKSDGTVEIKDCRREFHPLTGLINFFYISGDGQEAMPGEALPKPLQVGVANGQWPVKGAAVRFGVRAGNGKLRDNVTWDSKQTVTTGPDGVAQCFWRLDDGTWSQQVEAVLLDEGNNTIHLPIRFNANLSLAKEVYYDPIKCTKLSEVNNVQDAIDKLCEIERGVGCAVTIGDGGQYRTLREAFEGLKENGDVCLCLLPGSHEINEDLVVEDKNSIKITGCGSEILQYSQVLSLSANHILLIDFGLNVKNETGRVILAGSEVSAERCVFIRTMGSKEPDPLVLVSGTKSSGYTNVRWKNNRMVSSWVETVAEDVGSFLVPHKDVPIDTSMRNRLENLSKVNPYVDKEGYTKAVEAVVRDMERLSREIRTAWYDKRPVQKIEKLPRDLQEAVSEFYSVLLSLSRAPVTAGRIREVLEVVFAAFYIVRYAGALALERFAGGWIEDNVIKGSLILYHGEEYSRLHWSTTDLSITAAHPPGKQKFADDNQYIVVDPVNLNLRGNNVYAVYSNGYSIMQVIESIINTGEWQPELPEKGYKSITVAENVFNSNDNSFVCETMIMNGNQFTSATKENDIAAFVLGYSGVFMGNVAPDKVAVIEKILKTDRTENAANLLKIV